jgi:tRNA threonylcarbamoyladenosine biosynthesis protein TsaB
MTGILAIETATDVCSVAVYVDGVIRERHELAPRKHNQLLFRFLEELLPGGNLGDQGIDAIAYGSGPGSFTGLRIAASAVQGLAYSSDLPAIAVPTLTVLAQSALRTGLVEVNEAVICALDARINEVYSAVYTYEDNLAVLQQGPFACAPEDLLLNDSTELSAVGSGCEFVNQFPAPLRERIRTCHPHLAPAARDLIPLALIKLHQGDVQTPQNVQPIYVRDEISWKKLPQQGKNP